MPAAAPDIPIIAGFSKIASAYDIVMCDIRGVLHGGVAAFGGASSALTRFRQGGGTVVLVSNAPRPGASVVPQLDGLGVPRLAWDAIVTSGDVTRAMLDVDPTRPYFWLGPPRDGPLFAGLAPHVQELEEAALVVCTGLDDDTVETPADYISILTRARDLGLPFLCANPDLVVDRGGKLIYCAGALAEAYEALGGTVIYAGKPDLPIYRAALDVAASIRRDETPLSRIIAIGDALRTDIAGAVRFGCSSVFVAHGIHAKELAIGDDPLTSADMNRLLGAGEPRPSFAMDKLVW